MSFQTKNHSTWTKKLSLPTILKTNAGTISKNKKYHQKKYNSHNNA